MAECRVLPQGGVEQETLGLAVLWDEADAGLASVAHRGRRDVLTQQGDASADRVAGSDQRFDQFALAVALDAGDPEHLAAMHGEGDIVDRRAAVVVEHGEPLDLERDLVGHRRGSALG